MNIKEIDINQIKTYEKNAKKHDETQTTAIAKSIEKFGFRQPLVISKDNEIIVGHGRYLAALQLGMKTVPCEYADDLTDEQIKAYRLADNKLNESPWDFDRVDEELASISMDFDMTDFGFFNDDDFDVDAFFDDEPRQEEKGDKPRSGMETEKSSSKIQCPHCGEWFEI